MTQSYRNKVETGIVIRESAPKREEIYVTTKYSVLELDRLHSRRANFYYSLKNVSAVETVIMLRLPFSWVV